MLRSENQEGRAVEGVRAGGEDLDLLRSPLRREVHLGAIGSPDPLGLHLLHLLRPVQLVEILQKAVRILCDAKHPLPEILLRHRRPASLAFSVHDLFIRKTGLAAWAPVDRKLLFIGEAVLKHLHEDPLRPLIEFRIRGAELHVPVIERIDLLQLPLDILDIFLRRDRGMDAHFDRIVFRGESEGVPAHRMDDILPPDQLIPRPGIGNHIAPPVPHVEPGAGGIGEHIQTVILLLPAVLRIDGMLLPELLPLFFNRFMLIFDHSTPRLFYMADGAAARHLMSV